MRLSRCRRPSGVTIVAFPLGYDGGHICFHHIAHQCVTRAREPIEWDVPSLKELQNLASFCQNQENYNFRLYVAPVAILWVSLEGLNWVAGKLRHKGLISNPTFREQRHSTFTKAAN
jgi:hypothetical protein